MTAFPLHRRYLPIGAGLLSLFVASCKSTQGNKPGYADVVDYTSPNTGLSQEEYPFDKDGNYLADVVSGKTKGKPGSSSKVLDTPPAPQQTYVDTYEKPVITAVDTPSQKSNPIYERVPEPDASQPSASSGGGSSASSSSRAKSTGSSSSSSRPKTSTAGSASSKSKAKPVPGPKPKATVASKSAAKPKPKAPSSLSYTVKRGDTLYGLSSRYGVSVAAIKQANGLSSNVLRDGRTLRIPRK